ncbi:MAG: hypothetical protein SPL99_10920 [Catonella sp.]|nr:hypothetical protein [Catonella sp.]MDY6356950.1 hypothetical protein [Catonella sp.]
MDDEVEMDELLMDLSEFEEVPTVESSVCLVVGSGYVIVCK